MLDSHRRTLVGVLVTALIVAGSPVLATMGGLPGPLEEATPPTTATGQTHANCLEDCNPPDLGDITLLRDRFRFYDDGERVAADPDNEAEDVHEDVTYSYEGDWTVDHENGCIGGALVSGPFGPSAPCARSTTPSDGEASTLTFQITTPPPPDTFGHYELSFEYKADLGDDPAQGDILRINVRTYNPALGDMVRYECIVWGDDSPGWIPFNEATMPRCGNLFGKTDELTTHELELVFRREGPSDDGKALIDNLRVGHV